MGADRLKRLYDLAGYKDLGERVDLCARWFRFGLFGPNRERHLLNPMFCHLRLCPICIARGALVRGRMLSKVMDCVQAEKKCQYIFVTLALRNVPGDKLGEAISQLNEAWHRLIRQRPVARAFKGTFKAIEITRNNDPDSEWYGTYHPHIHAVVAVEDEYFAKNSPLFFTPEALNERWRIAARVDYKPTCNIKATYEKGKKKGRKKGKGGDDEASRGAVLEAAKYSTKDRDYISEQLTDEEAAQVVTDYTKALRHRRLAAFTGWLKEMAVRLKVEDLEKAELDDSEGGKFREDLAEVIEEYGWHFGAGDYVLARSYVNPLRIKREEADNGTKHD